jgi:hypothetical protein
VEWEGGGVGRQREREKERVRVEETKPVLQHPIVTSFLPPFQFDTRVSLARCRENISDERCLAFLTPLLFVLTTKTRITSFLFL